MKKGCTLKPSALTFTMVTALLAIVSGLTLFPAFSVPVNGESGVVTCDGANIGCVASKADMLTLAIQSIETPTIANIADKADGKGRVVAYKVETRGAITASLSEFKAQANETLNDKRGWAGMNISFQEVQEGGEFTLYFSEAAQMTSFSALGCDATYSCVVGRDVIINQDRWLSATPAWNAGGGSLRDYRHMVVSHEVGHWLGHGHLQCGGPGQPAPVMMQQSMDLQGCTFNPWPLDRELWSTRLGI